MAKKSVASLRSGKGKDFTKVITAVRSPKTGAYTFKEIIAHNDNVKEAVEAAKNAVN
jgi:folate-dependent phosphoribosylglycinamide formyltransferase PurN